MCTRWMLLTFKYAGNAFSLKGAMYPCWAEMVVGPAKAAAVWHITLPKPNREAPQCDISKASLCTSLSFDAL